MEKERAQSTQQIINSTDRYRLVAAGAGTGKSYTMLQILKQAPNKNYLVLTLTNELINDLEKDLGKHAECKTFHSLALEIFRKELNCQDLIYPKLQHVIEKDAKILNLGENLIQSLKEFKDENDQTVQEYLKRAQYYSAVGFDSLIYKITKYLKTNEEKIRQYDLVLIDEFQDFSRLETELVNILENKNDILIVGDDDQSIYGFRGAHPEFIRSKNTEGKYKTFSLPFCSRCTSVIVDSVNQIIRKAESDKIFKNRIKKEYKCYLPDKQSDSDNNPKIIHKHFSVQTNKSNYMGDFILHFYDNLPQFEKDDA